VTNAGIHQPWGRAPAYSIDFAIPEPIPATGQLATQDGPFYRNSRIRVADVTDGLSSTVFIGEHSSALSNKTWYGTVPYAATCPKNNWPSECNSAGCLLGVHSAPIPTTIHRSSFMLRTIRLVTPTRCTPNTLADATFCSATDPWILSPNSLTALSGWPCQLWRYKRLRQKFPADGAAGQQ